MSARDRPGATQHLGKPLYEKGCVFCGSPEILGDDDPDIDDGCQVCLECMMSMDYMDVYVLVKHSQEINIKTSSLPRWRPKITLSRHIEKEE